MQNQSKNSDHPLQIALHPRALPLGREFGHNDQQDADDSAKRHKFDTHMRRPSKRGEHRKNT
jgi:hypothetical protein